MVVIEGDVTLTIGLSENLDNSYTPDENGSYILDDIKASSSKDELVSFVVPIYNESENIAKNLDECVRVIREFGLPFEIVAVNDGSEDNTYLEVLKAASNHSEIIPITYLTNAGKGNALKFGAKWARGSRVIFMDADLEIHPRHAKQFITIMDETGADIVIGSKRHPASKVDYPSKRRFLSWGYHILICSMFGLKISDTQPGFKLFRKSVLDEELAKVTIKRYAFDLDLLARASIDGYKIVEAPIELKFNRKFGGRIGFMTVRSIFLETMSIFYHLRIRGRRLPRSSCHPRSSEAKRFQLRPRL